MGEGRGMWKGTRDLAWASSVGLTLVLCTVVGLTIGVWLDRWLHTAPWFTVSWLLMGIIAGFWNILKGLPKKPSREPPSHP
ncbi:MAG: AtpZ/AtpI family protein [Elusimicrobia bacterium]|nr:AtpZ/AtpI family protein [Elusimicrobiota bacterium]